MGVSVLLWGSHCSAVGGSPFYCVGVTVLLCGSHCSTVGESLFYCGAVIAQRLYKIKKGWTNIAQ